MAGGEPPAMRKAPHGVCMRGTTIRGTDRCPKRHRQAPRQPPGAKPRFPRDHVRNVRPDPPAAGRETR